MRKVFFETALMLAIAIGFTATASWTAGTAAKGADVYVCNCGPDCKCNTVSVNPGKCSCGLPMKKVE